MPPTDAPSHNEMLEHAHRALHARNERMTVPRRAVLIALAELEGHITAEQLVSDVADREPGVHRSSVYRALETLTTGGLVQHVHLAHGATAYHLVETAHPHAHCTTCGTVLDLPPDLLDAPSEALSELNGFVLDPTHVALAGTCSRCAGAGSNVPAERVPRPRRSG